MSSTLCNLLAVVRHAIRPSIGSSSRAPAPDVDLEELERRLSRRR
jgi:hypothetical protein